MLRPSAAVMHQRATSLSCRVCSTPIFLLSCLFTVIFVPCIQFRTGRYSQEPASPVVAVVTLVAEGGHVCSFSTPVFLGGWFVAWLLSVFLVFSYASAETSTRRGVHPAVEMQLPGYEDEDAEDAQGNEEFDERTPINTRK